MCKMLEVGVVYLNKTIVISHQLNCLIKSRFIWSEALLVDLFRFFFKSILCLWFLIIHGMRLYFLSLEITIPCISFPAPYFQPRWGNTRHYCCFNSSTGNLIVSELHFRMRAALSVSVSNVSVVSHFIN